MKAENDATYAGHQLGIDHLTPAVLRWYVDLLASWQFDGMAPVVRETMAKFDFHSTHAVLRCKKLAAKVGLLREPEPDPEVERICRAVVPQYRLELTEEGTRELARIKEERLKAEGVGG